MKAPGGSPEEALSIAQLTNAAKEVLEGAFPPIWIKGEVSNFTAHRNGHWYFSLRDATAQLSCVVWSRDTKRIPAPPDEGMQVMAHGQLSVYAARGQMQFMVRAMEAEGEGLWRKAFEKAKAALEKDGLLDPSRKRMLPRFPQRVAVITSPDGAALHDIISVIQRRNSGVEIIVIPAAVQGETAPDSLLAALDRLARWRGADVVIVGRGGGSREDLWAFNNERVARAIAACPVPTISAVGHEVDFTDCRSCRRFSCGHAECGRRGRRSGSRGYRRRHSWAWRFHPSRSRTSRARCGLYAAADFAGPRCALAPFRGTPPFARAGAGRPSRDFELPLATLARGYAVALNEKGGALPSAALFKPGMQFAMEMRDGRVHATADDVIVRPAAKVSVKPARKGAA